MKLMFANNWENNPKHLPEVCLWKHYLSHSSSRHKGKLSPWRLPGDTKSMRIQHEVQDDQKEPIRVGWDPGRYTHFVRTRECILP